MIQPVEGKTNLVVKRDGRTEEYDPQKMRKVILWASNNSEHFTNALLDAINIKIHNRIKIDKLYDEVIATASNLISDLYPQWETIAKNLYLLKLHKDLGVKRTEYPPYDDIVSANIMYGRVAVDTGSGNDSFTLASGIIGEGGDQSHSAQIISSCRFYGSERSSTHPWSYDFCKKVSNN